MFEGLLGLVVQVVTQSDAADGRLAASEIAIASTSFAILGDNTLISLSISSTSRDTDRRFEFIDEINRKPGRSQPWPDFKLAA
jgi:hypothetical protein